MSVRFLFLNLLVLGMGSVLLLACSSDQITPNPIFGSVNTTPTSSVATQPL